MKKRGIVLAVAVVALVAFVTGCGKKETLVCTQTASGVDITFNIGFDGSTITTMDFAYDMDLSSYSDTTIKYLEKQDWCSTVKSSMSEYKDAFTDCKAEIKDKKLNVASTLNVDKVAKSALGKMKTSKAAKKELEAEGYTCTIK